MATIKNLERSLVIRARLIERLKQDLKEAENPVQVEEDKISPLSPTKKNDDIVKIQKDLDKQLKLLGNGERDLEFLKEKLLYNDIEDLKMVSINY